MSKLKTVLKIVVPIVILLVGVGVFRFLKSTRAEPPRTERRTPGVLVSVEAVEATRHEVTVTAQGTATSGTIVTATDTVTHPLPPITADIILDKQIVNGDPYDSVGDVIEYNYIVENIGAQPVNNIVVTDAVDGGTVTCPQTTLALGEQMTCTATYTVTQADIDNGQVSSTATVNGEAADGSPVTNSDSQTATATQLPSIDIVKDITSITNPDPTNPDRYTDGSTINYEITATNTGNVTLTGVTVTDTAITNLTCTGGPDLAPGDTINCTGSYDTTQTDVDAGSVTNTATADGTAPDGTAPGTTQSDPGPAGDVDSEYVKGIRSYAFGERFLRRLGLVKRTASQDHSTVAGFSKLCSRLISQSRIGPGYQGSLAGKLLS